MSEHNLILGLGSNLGHRIDHIKKAIQLLSVEGICPQLISSYYETEPWGRKYQPDFINLVMLATTELTPEQSLQTLQSIEDKMGRTRDIHYGPRVIDLDILFYDQLILNSKNLTIPHPHIQHRKFVLIPLREILPDFIHPVFKASMDTLTQLSTDLSRVIKLQKHETLS